MAEYNDNVNNEQFDSSSDRPVSIIKSATESATQSATQPATQPATQSARHQHDLTNQDEGDKLLDSLSRSSQLNVRRVCSLNLKKGKKYHISGDVHAAGNRMNNVTFIVDSAADISIIPISMVGDIPKLDVDQPIEVRGFNGQVGATIMNKVDVEVRFSPGKLRAPFYVCEAPFAIIGTDLLQAKELKLALSTGDGVFKVGGVNLVTKPSVETSLRELERRKKMGERNYNREKKMNNEESNWMRVTQARVLAPHSTTFVSAHIPNKTRINYEHSLLSFFDEEELDIYVPSLSFGSCVSPWGVPVHNSTGAEVKLCRGFILGEIVAHGPMVGDPVDADVNVAEMFELQAVMREISLFGEEGKMEPKIENTI